MSLLDRVLGEAKRDLDAEHAEHKKNYDSAKKDYDSEKAKLSARKDAGKDTWNQQRNVDHAHKKMNDHAHSARAVDYERQTGRSHSEITNRVSAHADDPHRADVSTTHKNALRSAGHQAHTKTGGEALRRIRKAVDKHKKGHAKQQAKGNCKKQGGHYVFGRCIGASGKAIESMSLYDRILTDIVQEEIQEAREELASKVHPFVGKDWIDTYVYGLTEAKAPPKDDKEKEEKPSKGKKPKGKDEAKPEPKGKNGKKNGDDDEDASKLKGKELEKAIEKKPKKDDDKAEKDDADKDKDKADEKEDKQPPKKDPKAKAGKPGEGESATEPVGDAKDDAKDDGDAKGPEDKKEPEDKDDAPGDDEGPENPSATEPVGPARTADDAKRDHATAIGQADQHARDEQKHRGQADEHRKSIEQIADEYEEAGGKVEVIGGQRHMHPPSANDSPEIHEIYKKFDDALWQRDEFDLKAIEAHRKKREARGVARRHDYEANTGEKWKEKDHPPGHGHHHVDHKKNGDDKDKKKDDAKEKKEESLDACISELNLLEW